MGPLTDDASVTRFEAAVDAARDAGGEVLTGGSESTARVFCRTHDHPGEQ